MRIRRVDIENFRGIKAASWRLPPGQRFFALIGPGDSTKTTILTALERALHDRSGQSVLDTDFFQADITHPIRIRVAVDELPDDLIALDAFGGFLAGIDDEGEWTHDPNQETQSCVIIEFLVEADLDPIWQSYRPPLEGLDDEEPPGLRGRGRGPVRQHPGLVRRRGASGCADPARRGLRPRGRRGLRGPVGGRRGRVHLTIDLDVLPASVAPGVSAPAGLGVEARVVLGAVRRVAASGKLGVLEVAELNPLFDVDGRTARTAARLVDAALR